MLLDSICWDCMDTFNKYTLLDGISKFLLPLAVFHPGWTCANPAGFGGGTESGSLHRRGRLGWYGRRSHRVGQRKWGADVTSFASIFGCKPMTVEKHIYIISLSYFVRYCLVNFYEWMWFHSQTSAIFLPVLPSKSQSFVLERCQWFLPWAETGAAGIWGRKGILKEKIQGKGLLLEHGMIRL